MTEDERPPGVGRRASVSNALVNCAANGASLVSAAGRRRNFGPVPSAALSHRRTVLRVYPVRRWISDSDSPSRK